MLCQLKVENLCEEKWRLVASYIGIHVAIGNLPGRWLLEQNQGQIVFGVGAWKQIFVIRQLVDEEVAIWERRRRCLQHL